MLSLACSADRAIFGVVEDETGRPISGAEVELFSAPGMSLARASTDARGGFRLTAVRPGAYLFEVRASRFQTQRSLLRVEEKPPAGPHRVLLLLQPLHTQVTVTAARGSVEEVQEMPQVVAVVEGEDARQRGHPTLGNALAGSPGVHLQQSTAGQASPFLRGLTGFHVLHLVDGIRFNNSTFRFGPNQYLALLEPSHVQRVETTLGPAAVEYGSDALGGAIQVVNPSPSYSETGRWQSQGRVSGFLGSADLSGGGSGQLTLSHPRVAFLAGGVWRRYNDLRAGGGFDSHHALRRFLGLSGAQVRGLLGSRQRDTAFSQFGGHARLNFRLGPAQQLTLWHQHSTQRGVRGYKDLWGGLGRLQAAFTPQALNFFYARHQKQNLGVLDSLTSTFSINSQHDGFVSQGLRRNDPVLVDRSRVDAYGYAAQARAHRGSRQMILLGGEFYDERVHSLRLVVPGQARYRHLSFYGETSAESAGRRLRAAAGGRLTRVAFAGRRFADPTFNAALSFRAAESARLHLVVARGFRAPNLNDLATLGLQDLGFEFPAEALARAGALIGSSSGEAALSTGRSVEPLGAERLFNYEAGLTWQNRGAYLRAQVFDAELYDAIARRTILFPRNSLPPEISGVRLRPVAATPDQAAQGVLGAATDFDPRAIKAFVNVGRQRYSGAELLLRQKLPRALTFSAHYSFLLGRELDSGVFVRRLPPQQGLLSLLYHPVGRLWMELSLEAAGAQRRLSGGDLGDERIGAERSRADIARFFAGDRLRPFVREGVFLPTGETLEQIQRRILPPSLAATDDTRVPLFPATPGYAALHFRGGFPVSERNQLTVSATNLTDRNYRRHGSGLDAPGFHLLLGWELRF